MNDFSEDLMEDIMCMTSFSKFHSDEETAKPVRMCWGKRNYRLPLEDVGIPAAALRLSATDSGFGQSYQGTRPTSPTPEPMFGKGRARVLKDHPLAESSVRRGLTRSPLTGYDDFEDRFEDFDPSIQAEVSELGTAHRVDVVPKVAPEVEKKASSDEHVAAWLLNNIDNAAPGTRGSRSTEFARKVNPRGSRSDVRSVPLKTTNTRNGYHQRVCNSSSKDWRKDCANVNNEGLNPVPEIAYRSLSSSSSLASGCPSSSSRREGKVAALSDVPVINSNKVSLEYAPVAKVVTSDNSSVQLNSLSNGALPLNSHSSAEDCSSDDGTWAKIKQLKDTTKQVLSYPPDTETRTPAAPTNFVPAGAERFQVKSNGVKDQEDGFNCSDDYDDDDDDDDNDDLTWTRKKGPEVNMYINSAVPTSKVTFGDYIVKNKKIKKPGSRSCFGQVKPTTPEPQLSQEYFPELPTSNPSHLETIAASNDKALSFNMKDVAAELRGTEKPVEIVEDVVQNGHGDGIREGTLMKIDGLPTGVTAKQLKEYLETFGEVSHIDLCSGKRGQLAKVYMKNASDCKWIKSCLHGEPTSIGDDADNCVLTVKVIEK